MTGMVSMTAIVAMAINVLICFGVPLALLVWLVVKKKSTARPVFVGVVIFFVFQMLLRIPILQNVLSPMPWFRDMARNIWVYAIFLALTAGLFEEVGRFLGYKKLLKQQRCWWDGFAFGVGHGGIEAILLTGMTNINNLVLAFLINSGNYEIYAQELPQETAQLIYQQMVGVGAAELLMGGLERIFAITIQIAFSILVLYAVRVKHPLYLVLAIALHTLVDAPVVILQLGFGWNVYALEALIAVMAVVAGAFIWYSHKLFVKMDGTDCSLDGGPFGPSYIPPTPYVPG